MFVCCFLTHWRHSSWPKQCGFHVYGVILPVIRHPALFWAYFLYFGLCSWNIACWSFGSAEYQDKNKGGIDRNSIAIADRTAPFLHIVSVRTWQWRYCEYLWALRWCWRAEGVVWWCWLVWSRWGKRDATSAITRERKTQHYRGSIIELRHWNLSLDVSIASAVLVLRDDNDEIRLDNCWSSSVWFGMWIWKSCLA